jgi:hypothetical protein
MIAKSELDRQFSSLDKEIDTNFLAEKLRLKENGGTDGKDNLPKPGASIMSPTELNLIAHLNKISGSAFNIYSKNTADLIQERINLKNDLNLEQDIQSINQIDQSYKPQISYLIEDGRNKIIDAAGRFGNSVRNFRNFVLQNDLTTRSAVYPSSDVSHLKWVLVGGIVELVIAAFYYTEAAANPLAGLAFALLIVVTNVLVAFIAGDRLRFINHKNISLKVWYTTFSVCLFLIFLAAIIYGALLRQALVDLLEVNPDAAENLFNVMNAAGVNAAKTVIASPFSFVNNAVTTLIFIASLAFGILVSYKGYRRDDEYPGYGDADRTRNASQKKLEETETEFYKLISEFHKNLEADIRKKVEQIRGRCEQIISTIEDHKFMINHAERKFIEIEKAANGCLSMYRAANEFVRHQPAPDYFKQKFTLDDHSHENLPKVSESDLEIESLLKHHVQQVMENLNATVSKLNHLQHETLSSLQAEFGSIRKRAVDGDRRFQNIDQFSMQNKDI